MEPVYHLVRNILKPWLASWFRWTIEGEDNIPSEGPAIIAFNHIAYLDPLAAAYVVDRNKRRPRFLTKAELFEDKRIGWIFRHGKQIEVRRGTPDAPMALATAITSLEQGEVVVMFPEGTITTDPHLEPMEARSGLARLALATGVPIIPAAVWGTANVWPKGYAKHWWPPRQDVLVRFGEAMQAEGDADSRDDWKRVGAEVMDAITVLLAGLRPAVADRRRPKKPGS